MCELCRKSLGSDERIGRIRRLCHRIISALKPQRLVLFGSFARGDFHEGSDADFLVVGGFEERFFDRIGKVIGLGDGSIGVDALAYTPSEFKRLVAGKNPLVMRALREGLEIV
ncbi:nucleotidyltransferase domain-containing protein [Candidatus Micrarchaeota archaeon]|nr:nucleotidyltransferase domain-containing protein [Candidatus Micrarchaeota archaeon]